MLLSAVAFTSGMETALGIFSATSKLVMIVADVDPDV